MFGKKKISPAALATDAGPVDFAVAYRNKETAKLKRRYYFKNNLYLYLMIVPVVVWFLIFAYWPLTYLVIASVVVSNTSSIGLPYLLFLPTRTG